MKRKLLVLTLAATLSAGAASFAGAEAPQTGSAGVTDTGLPGRQHPGAGFKQARENKMAARAALLGLTDAQQTQIKGIITVARQANAPLIQKIAADRKNLRELSKAVPFDEASVRTLIAGGEAVRTDLALSRIKVRNQIQAVLTPAQQAKAKELRLFESKRQHGWGNSGF